MSEIRTRIQGGTPFFPNMLNNGNVEVCLKEDVDKVLAEKDAEIAELKKEISRQKRLRCYNLKMWCSAERFTNRGRTIPDEGRWWERHFYSVCRVWERLKEATR